MTISIKFLSILKNHAGTDSFELSNTGGKTLREVLLIVDRQFFSGTNLVFDTGGVHVNPALLVMVNGQDYHLLENQLDTLLEGTEEILLLSSLHGG